MEKLHLFAVKSAPAALEPSETMVSNAMAIKVDNKGLVTGWAVVFEGDDLSGQHFKKETDYDIEDGDDSTTYYDHTFDETLGDMKFAAKAIFTIKDEGVWFEHQLNLADSYEKKVNKLIKLGKLGVSTGTAKHLVRVEETDDGEWIKAWPLGKDLSYTATPCEPRTRSLEVKNYQGTDRPSFKAMIADLEDEDDFSDYAYTGKTTIGEALGTKLLFSFTYIAGQLLNQQALRLKEFAACHVAFAEAIAGLVAAFPEGIADKELDYWRSYEIGYKSSDTPNDTIGDCIAAGQLRSFNAGADYLLTEGVVSMDERKAMGAAFETFATAVEAAMPEAVWGRLLKDAGNPYLYIKSATTTISGEEEAPAAKTLAEEAQQALAAVAALKTRLTLIGERRAGEGRELGPTAVKHIDDTLAALAEMTTEIATLEEAFKAIKPPTSEQAKRREELARATLEAAQ